MIIVNSFYLLRYIRTNNTSNTDAKVDGPLSYSEIFEEWQEINRFYCLFIRMNVKLCTQSKEESDLMNLPSNQPDCKSFDLLFER